MIIASTKWKVDFINKFDKILDIIYYNIILCVILLLLTLVVPVKVDSLFEGLKVVIIYLFVSFMYMFVRRRIKYNESVNIKNRK